MTQNQELPSNALSFALQQTAAHDVQQSYPLEQNRNTSCSSYRLLFSVIPTPPATHTHLALWVETIFLTTEKSWFFSLSP